ncbi:MAG: TldD/PmbA family protein, partial [Alphaproteobacteria bacterium]
MDVASDATDLLSYVIAEARRGGADAADAVFVSGAALSHAQRFGKTERLDRAESNELGLRVFLGKRQAIASSSDQSR